jgi:uncharacterized membrane protein
MTTSAANVQSTYTPPAPSAAGTARITSIDVMRGVVMVLMAIDHVRVYSGIPAGGPTAGIFFTRWVTHFCAPLFVFLAGTSAFLYGRRLGDTRRLAGFLVKRGLLLIALELTLIHVSWTFTLGYANILAGVIWMLGWCMILMAGLVRFSPKTIGIFGITVMVAQSALHFVAKALPVLTPLWQFLFLGGRVPIGNTGTTFTVLYNIVPWIGVMAAGYAFGTIMVRDAAERRARCYQIGLGMVAAFVVVGGALALAQGGKGEDGQSMPLLFRLLDQNKYRDSQLFLLMTLGPAIALLPFAESVRGWIARAFETFGRVPMFYYLLHIPLIHATALVVWYLRDGAARGDRFDNAPYVSIPDNERWSLSLLYLVFAILIAMLYPACRWFQSVKARRPGSWLRYL